jgi:hypothetical protein
MQKVLLVQIVVDQSADLQSIAEAVAGAVESELMDLNKCAIATLGEGVKLESIQWDHESDRRQSIGPYGLAGVAG